jgi:hemerythrin-like metal-binding protein
MNTPYTHLVWNDSYTTGVPEIDEQHMILVHTLNEAGEKLVNNSKHELLEQITQDLLSYALYHFDTEEALMQEYGYPDGPDSDMGQHLKQHRSFSAKVVAIREGLKAGAPISSNDLLEFLNAWLINHILNTDRKLGSFIVKKRLGD